MSRQTSADETLALLGPSPHAAEAGQLGSREDETAVAFRITAAMYSFAVLGLFASSIGVMLPHISQHYGLTDLHVSLIFLVGPFGYVLAAQSNAFIHAKLGQFGIAILGPIFHILAAAAISAHPPFPVLLLAVAFSALGIGLLDGSWCAWVGNMENANFLSGLLHGSFSVGAAAGPLLAGTMMSAGLRPWYEWYYVLAGASVVELIILGSAFQQEDASRYHRNKRTGESDSKSKHIFSHRATWLAAAYHLAVGGTETAISGWIVSFLIRARHATPYQASLSSSGFWAGMAVGRFALGTATDKMGVRRATGIYLVCAIVFEAIFAVVRIPWVSIAFMTVLGFIMGPNFPSGIVVLTRRLPKELHVAAVAFVASLGQVGAAMFPFGIGAVIHGAGIGVFPFTVLALSALTLALWTVFSNFPPVVAVPADDEQQEN